MGTALTGTHVVRPGETLDGIAQAFGLTAATVWYANENGALRMRLGDPAWLVPGDVVHVPAAGALARSKGRG